MLSSYFTNIRFSSCFASESSKSFHVKTAFTVITDMPTPGFENRIADLRCLVNRSKSEKFFQAVLFGQKDRKIFQTKQAGNFSIHSFNHIIQVGMNGINSNIIF